MNRDASSVTKPLQIYNSSSSGNIIVIKRMESSYSAQAVALISVL
jgi:hypothetical protein